jgi:hypothetical protein
MRNVAFGLAMIMLLLAAAANLHADIIDVGITPTGTGGLLGVGVDPDWIVIYKDFNPTVGLGPVDLRITVDAPGDYIVYEKPYQTYNGFIHNISGFCWTDFHFQLIGNGWFNYGSAANDKFASSFVTNTTIDLWDGSVPQGTDFHPGFAFHANAEGDYIIKEWATVPEPSALVLLGIGAISLLRYGWRRRR